MPRKRQSVEPSNNDENISMTQNNFAELLNTIQESQAAMCERLFDRMATTFSCSSPVQQQNRLLSTSAGEASTTHESVAPASTSGCRYSVAHAIPPGTSRSIGARVTSAATRGMATAAPPPQPAMAAPAPRVSGVTHSGESCTTPKRQPRPFCVYCKHYGHQRDQCRKLLNQGESSLNNSLPIPVSCYQCGSENVTRENCKSTDLYYTFYNFQFTV
ncbi:hypothetical protein ACJJTC_011948 [Scirpophaga incertulas]